MRRRESVLLVVALGLIGSSVFVLGYFKNNQRLGRPGLRCSPIEGSIRVKIELPTNALGFTGVPIPVSERVIQTLPADTSMAQMFYTNAAGLGVYCSTVMMGIDRTSIHKPQYCLTAQGYRIDETRSEKTTLRVYKPEPVDLPVVKLVATKETTRDGKPVLVSCVFVYWLVAGDQVLADQTAMSLNISLNLLRTGQLQRWSYIFYLAECIPGREDAAYAHIGSVINATLPSFQLTWPPGDTRAGAP